MARHKVDAIGSLRKRLGRRAFVRGAAATVVGLPLFEAMLNDNGTALADGTTRPCRYVLLFCPTALVCSGSRSDGMVPTTTGPGYERTRVLQPLQEHGVDTDVSIVSGLYCAPHSGPPGAYDSDYHGQAYKALVSGVSSGFGGVEWRPYGLSVDEVISQNSPAGLRFRKLYYQIDPAALSYKLSFEARDDGFVGIDPETSPRNAYRALFQDFVPPDDEVDPQIEIDRRLRQSSLSYASEQIESLRSDLGVADRRTLDEHLTHIRELERRLAAPSMSHMPTCVRPTEPTDPGDIAPSVPDQQARAEVFVDLTRLAFACDMTRTVTISGSGQLTGAGMRHELWQSAGGLHGEVQHSSGDQDLLDTANRSFVNIYAELLAQLKATPEGEGNLLDESVGVFLMEGGKGLGDRSRSGDGGGDSNHSCDNMVMLVGGRSGGLAPKGHLDFTGDDRHPAEVLNAAIRAVGGTDTLGEVTGVVNELF